MIYIENIFVCLAIPLVLCILFMGGRTRTFMLFMITGMGVCLLSAYVNSFFIGHYGVSATVAVVEITPVCEEVMKLLPLLFYFLIFEPRVRDLPEAAIALAVGFATFENVCYLTENGAENFVFLLIRGISAGALHILCGISIGFGLSYVSNQTIEKIIKLLRCAFKQAVRWEIIARNPFDNVILPKTEYKKRDIWDADMIRTALDKCTDSKLYVAMNLSFACSLRMGEILGLTWDNVHISDEDIAADNAYVYVDKELTRASKRAIETLGEKDIYYIFTPLMPNTSTRIILKKPKTESSIRKVWLPKTLAYILREWKKSQDGLRSFLGDEYQDFNLVVALPNGRPCEDRIILKEFSKLREEAGLPRVVFHSLRHSSTTYKLKLNHGDLKATQGDTGHAEIDMITSIYAHILDEDRKVNAQKFETAFYANPDLRGVRPPEELKQPEPATLDLASLVEQLQKSPELASALAALIAAQAPAK